MGFGHVRRRRDYHSWRGVSCLAVLGNGDVVSGGDDEAVRLWDSAIGHFKKIITHEGWVDCLAVLGDGRVVSGSRDCTVRLWNPATGYEEKIITHDKRVRCLAVLGDGHVVSGGDDKTVRLWSPGENRVSDVLFARSSIQSLARSENSSKVHAGLANGEVLFLQVESPDSARD